MDSIDPHNSYVGQFWVIMDHLESVLLIQEQCDSIDLLNHFLGDSGFDVFL